MVCRNVGFNITQIKFLKFLLYSKTPSASMQFQMMSFVIFSHR